MDNTRFDSNERPEEKTNIFVSLMLDIPDDNIIPPINIDVTNIIIINGMYAISYALPANIYNIGLDNAAMPKAAGMYTSETIFNNILMLDLKAILLSSEKNDDNFGINKFETG